MQTKNVIRHTLQERAVPNLVVHKVYCCVHELQMELEDMYGRLKSAMEKVDFFSGHVDFLFDATAACRTTKGKMTDVDFIEALQGRMELHIMGDTQAAVKAVHSLTVFNLRLC